ncbi:hypothetical protein DITRI_Ditri20bG0084800 [Diplodiscus trichospermus]
MGHSDNGVASGSNGVLAVNDMAVYDDPQPLASLPPTGQDPFMAQDEEEEEEVAVQAPIISQYKHQIRPLLDAIDRLRLLNVMKEGIQPPTIQGRNYMEGWPLLSKFKKIQRNFL